MSFRLPAIAPLHCFLGFVAFPPQGPDVHCRYMHMGRARVSCAGSCSCDEEVRQFGCTSTEIYCVVHCWGLWATLDVAHPQVVDAHDIKDGVSVSETRNRSLGPCEVCGWGMIRVFGDLLNPRRPVLSEPFTGPFVPSVLM